MKPKKTRKQKPRTNEWHRKKCSELAKKIARTKAKFKCAYCGKGEPHNRTHGSHIWAEGRYRNMSADVDNILCLCADHHSTMPGRSPRKDFNWHAYPAESMEWFNEKYPKLAKKLKLRTQKIYRVNFEKKREELKKELAELGG